MIASGLTTCRADAEIKMTQALELKGDGALAQSNMIRITLKLFALSGYLPDGATRTHFAYRSHYALW